MMTSNLLSLKKRLDSMSPTKRNPIYNSHMYWSQKAYNIADALITELTNEGDFIFDPFMGSGVTIIEAVSDKAKRNAIGVDINDVPIFITKTVLKQRDSAQTVKIIDQFVKECIKECRHYYVFNADKNALETTYVLFDIKNGKYKIKEIRAVDAKGKKLVIRQPDEMYVKSMFFKYKPVNIKDKELIENSKIAVKKHQKLSSIFTPRNFAVIDKIIGVLNKECFSDYYDILKYIILSMIHLCKITDTHSMSQWPLWIPKNNCVEKNVIKILERRAKLTQEAVKYVGKNYKKATDITDVKKAKGNSNYKLIKKPIQNITVSDIPDKSVDLIITDPPYLGQVVYSEYMQLYESFLGFKINYKDEIVVSSSPEREKDVEDYFSLISDGFRICSRKLKDSKHMCMYFHDCNLKVWDRLISILSANDLRFLSIMHIDKTSTLKNIISPKKSLNGDALLFFVKDKIVSSVNKGNESIEIIVHSVIKEARHMIETNGGKMTTPELYDNGLMEIIIHNGWLNKLSKEFDSLVDIFERHFIWNEKGSFWSLE